MSIEILAPLTESGGDWIAVEKPAGMSLHNDPGRDLCSRVAELLTQARSDRAVVCEKKGTGVFPVHRLDKETSGVVLFALNRDCASFLAQQFQHRQVSKRYTALLHGEVSPPPGGQAWLRWDEPLTKQGGGRRDPAGRGKRLASATRYRTIGCSTHYSLVLCAPHTGRKHQIRRHTKLAGHPVVGDKRYGSPRSLKYQREKCHFNRLALHAHSLEFQPGPNASRITVCSPRLPGEIQALWEADRAQ